MRLVFVSDTHNRLSRIPVPDGDMLFIAGDWTMRKDDLPHMTQIERFNEEVGALPHRFKVAIAGNHDLPMEVQRAEAQALLTNVIYLEDELIELAGLRIYGSPWQPEYKKWSFNLPRGSAALAEKWRLIPDRVDILVTHGPPKGILDRTPSGQSVGDELLLDRVLQVRPRIHCFGHVHHSHGVHEEHGIKFVNAASVSESYTPHGRSIVIDI